MLSFFFPLIVFSAGELPVDKKWEFSSFLWVWKSLWPRVNGCHLLSSSPFMAFHVSLISSRVPFILQPFPFMLHSFPFILHSCPFIFRSGGYPPKHSRFCHISLSFWLSFGYRFEGLCRLPSQASWTCAYICSLSFFSSYRFLGRQRSGSVKVQAKLKCNARGYYTIPCEFTRG